MKNRIKTFLRWVIQEEISKIEDKAGKLDDKAKNLGIKLKKLDVKIKKYDSLNEIRIAKEKKLDNILGNIDVGVAHHSPSRDWACISIQGEKSDYIKFVDLRGSDIREIRNFLSKFDRKKVDANPTFNDFFKKIESK